MSRKGSERQAHRNRMRQRILAVSLETSLPTESKLLSFRTPELQTTGGKKDEGRD